MKPLGETTTIRLVPGAPHELDAEIDRLASDLKALVAVRKCDRMSASRLGSKMGEAQRAAVSAGMKAYHLRKKAAAV